MNTALVSYLGDPTLKARLIVEIEAHEIADEITKGTYGSMNGSWRGCAIGCSLRSLNRIQGAADINLRTDVHERFPKELGWPLWLAYLEDNIFENLPMELAKTWPRRLVDAVPVGAVIPDRVLAQILVWILTDGEFGLKHATGQEEIRAWINAVATFIDADSLGTATAEQHEAAAWDAWDARAARDAWAARAARAARAAWAARDAWDAWDAWAARAAWDAWAARDAWDAWAAWDAWDAWAAWDAWDARDARDAKKAAAFFPALSEYVLSLLRALPVQEAA